MHAEDRCWNLPYVGSRRVDVRQEIDNKKYGHRVRAQFPFSGITSIYADNQFEVKLMTIKLSSSPRRSAF